MQRQVGSATVALDLHPPRNQQSHNADDRCGQSDNPDRAQVTKRNGSFIQAGDHAIGGNTKCDQFLSVFLEFKTRARKKAALHEGATVL